MQTSSINSSTKGTASSCSDSTMSFLIVSTVCRKKMKRAAKRLRQVSFVHRLLPLRYTVDFEDISRALTDGMFRKMYRMSRSAFNLLLDLIRDIVDKPFKSGTEFRRSTVPSDIKLALTLKMMAGANVLDLVLAYQVAERTVYDIFESTCDALMQRLHLRGFPRTEQALQVISKRFTSSRRHVNPISGCVGALDGICIQIKKPEPKENPALFYCHKGFYAVPVQALVDSDYIFRFCSANCTGATHDSLAYSVSGLKREIDRGVLGESYYIVGDEAYTCTEHLITPFPKSIADADQDNFNFFLSSMRIHVEQAFGMLVARWRILKVGLQFSVDKSTDLICLAMKLHNFCLEYDKERPVLVWELTESEKDTMESDINLWCRESREAARELQNNAPDRRPVHEGTVSPRIEGFSSKRDRLVQIVNSKGRERPEVVLPAQHYDIDSDRM